VGALAALPLKYSSNFFIKRPQLLRDEKKEATQFSIPLIKSSSFNTLTKRALKKLFE
jgi:hypothetical protein